MADSNLPSGPDVTTTTPPTQAELVEDIGNLIDDSPENPVPDHDEAAAPKTKSVEEDNDPLGLNEGPEDVEPDPETDPDGSEAEIKAGRYAPDSAKTKLEDGSTITISELKSRTDKRIKDFQRDYTDKTTALKAKETEVDQFAQSLNQSRDYLAWYAEQFLPQQPEPFKGAPDDYVGFIEWQRQDAAWRTHAQAYQAFQAQKEADEQRKSSGTLEQATARRQTEAKALLDAMPVLKDPAKGKVAWEIMQSGAQENYGITAAEVNAVEDHRLLLALRDAIAYRRLKAKAPQVQERIAKPAMQTGRRAAPSAQATKQLQNDTERLRKTGTLQDGIAALQHFDL